MFQDDVCVRRYLDGLAEGTRRNRLPLIESFFGFVGVGPSDAVEFMRLHPIDYRFVDSAYKWVESGGLAASTMRNRVSWVRGFFLANRAPLPKDKHRFHSDKQPVVGELDVDEFRKILASCNLTKRAAYLVMFQSGSGVGELLHINRYHAEHVWNEIRKGKKIIRLTMPGRKQNRNIQPYYTFIGSDATDALRQLFHSEGWKRRKFLFYTERDEPESANSLQAYFRSHAFKVGVLKRCTFPCLDCGGETVRHRRKKEGVSRIFYVCTVCQSVHLSKEYNVSHHVRGGIRYRMKTHELRDLFRTEFHRAQTYNGADASCGEFFMGHSIDPLKYDKIMRDLSYGLSEYRKAMSFLNVLSEDARKVDRSEIDSKLVASETKVEVLSRELARLRGDFEKVSWLSDPEKAKDILEGLRLLRKKEKGEG